MGAVLVAERDGLVVGFAAGWVEHTWNIAEAADSNRVGYISDICVFPPHRGRGIAGHLLDALANHLAATGVTRIRIGSLAANQPARTSYERAGFVPYEIMYEKKLPVRSS